MSRFRHLQIIGGVQAEEYRYPHKVRGAKFRPPPRDDELSHARALRGQLDAAQQQAVQLDGSQPVAGLILTFESEPTFLLKSDSLDDRRAAIRLLSVKTEGTKQLANVFVPRDAFAKLIRKIDDYEDEQKRTKKGHRKNKPLIDSIGVARLAIARDLWTDARPFPTANAAIWWEVWLRAEQGEPRAVHAAFTDQARALGLDVSTQRLEFPERVVTLLRATPSDWSRSRLLLMEVAELRYPAEPATPYLDLTPEDQSAMIADAVARIRPARLGAPAVCLLDTGVRRAHPLLEASLLEQDMLAVDPEWGTADHHDRLHGTCMAGNALHGCLTEVFQSRETMELAHRLESVKIFPPRAVTRPELYGETIRQAAARVEVAQPERSRVLCMAVTDTHKQVRDGRPTSWSAAIDQLTWNGGADTRLLCVSAGNLREQMTRDYTYPHTNFASDGVIEDPAQAWNAITVGAFAGRHQVTSSKYTGWSAMAPFGGLTPTSRTTAAWEAEGRSVWPYKPDIVMDGGNWGRDDSGDISHLEDLGLLTTGFGRSGAMLDFNADTSAATALASRACAMIQAAYPDMRPETVRSVLVHAARWTRQMETDCPGNSRADRIRRLRVFGYGVPDLAKAIWSVRNHVTLVAEGALTPFILTTDGPKSNQMAVHALPWPSAVLASLGDTPVTLRVTLSYFVEPSPGSRGWTRSFRYASHGLRFDIKRPEESQAAFLGRLSAAARDEDANPATTDDSSDPGWMLGPKYRVRGSLHSDWWSGRASELAGRDTLAVYPVTGWWRERPHLGKVETTAPYSLCLSIETPSQDIDLYTPIVNLATIAVPITA